MYSHVSAQVWGIEWIDIIPRTERWATESWWKLFWWSWINYLNTQNVYEARLAWEWDDPDGSFAARKDRADVQNKRIQFLLSNYPRESTIAKTVREVWADKLVWSRQYAANKSKIVVHHTAWSQVYNTPAVALVWLQDIYKFHTLTRWWWDVGYNFLIDPYGNIYEWRAGGAWVVWAHADWNNISTIGIALMGNFDLAPPTDEAWESLKKLSIALALKYDIDPYATANYFLPVTEEPFISAHTDHSLVWHQDVKATWCPWTEVYARLPELRAEVDAAVKILRGSSAGTEIHYVDHETATYLTASTWKISVPFAEWGKVSCSALQQNVRVTDCTRWANNILDIYLAHADYPASGWQSVVVDIGTKKYVVSFMLVWEKDLELLRQTKKEAYEKIVPPRVVAPSEKLAESIPVSRVSDVLENDINVLLYELSTDLPDWDIECSAWCTLVLDDDILQDISAFRIIKRDAWLRVFIWRDIYDTTKLFVKNPELVTFVNYARTYANFPMNIFVGDLTLQSQVYKDLDLWRTKAYVWINSVDFNQYMWWVGEISEQQHPEKITLMSLLTKSYMLYYGDGSNVHPSIPDNANYNAVDDPRIFQRYFGAWFSAYGKQRIQSLEKTKDQYISYDWYLPILPYFHCSAWYTKSWKEHFGRTDTPWLTSVLDVATCQSWWFEGHGVWLSWDGAEALAQIWMSYEDILKWYYEGVEIEEL